MNKTHRNIMEIYFWMIEIGNFLKLNRAIFVLYRWNEFNYIIWIIDMGGWVISPNIVFGESFSEGSARSAWWYYPKTTKTLPSMPPPHYSKIILSTQNKTHLLNSLKLGFVARTRTIVIKLCFCTSLLATSAILYTCAPRHFRKGDW